MYEEGLVVSVVFFISRLMGWIRSPKSPTLNYLVQ
jgi:hypothetical protein